MCYYYYNTTTWLLDTFSCNCYTIIGGGGESFTFLRSFNVLISAACLYFVSNKKITPHEYKLLNFHSRILNVCVPHIWHYYAHGHSGHVKVEFFFNFYHKIFFEMALLNKIIDLFIRGSIERVKQSCYTWINSFIDSCIPRLFYLLYTAFKSNFNVEMCILVWEKPTTCTVFFDKAYVRQKPLWTATNNNNHRNEMSTHSLAEKLILLLMSLMSFVLLILAQMAFQSVKWSPLNTDIVL